MLIISLEEGWGYIRKAKRAETRNKLNVLHIKGWVVVTLRIQGKKT